MCTGMTIAMLESLILCPLERIKVFFMTQNLNNRIGYVGFMKKYNS